MDTEIDLQIGSWFTVYTSFSLADKRSPLLINCNPSGTSPLDKPNDALHDPGEG